MDLRRQAWRRLAFVGADALKRQLSGRMVFVIESQHTAMEHRARTASELVSPVFSRDKLVEGDLSSALSQRLDVRDRSIDFGLPQMPFRHDPGYRATMADDDHGFSTLDDIEELGKASPCLRGLNYANDRNPPIGLNQNRLVDCCIDDE
jgi:hypothetical protein